MKLKIIMYITLFIIAIPLVLLALLSNADRKIIFQKSRTFSFADTNRTYIEHLPVDKPTKLIIAIHELGGNGKRFAYYTGLHNAVDSNTVVIYPDAVKPTSKNERPGWNASFCCGSGWVNKQDDAGYIVALSKYIAQQYGISAKDTYLVGFSNGSMLVLRTASEHPESFGGVAISSGSMGANSIVLKPSAPLPILLMHGKDDTTVPYNGGPGKDPTFVWQSFDQSRRLWLDANNPSDPVEAPSLFGAATNYTGEYPVRSIETQGSAHTWIGWRIANIWHKKPLMSQEIILFLDSI